MLQTDVSGTYSAYIIKIDRPPSVGDQTTLRNLTYQMNFTWLIVQSFRKLIAPPFPGIKRPERGVDLPTPYSAKVKERIELHLWALVACYRVIFSFTRYWPGKSKFKVLRRQQTTLPGNMCHCFVCARDVTTRGSRSGSCEKCFIVICDAVCFGIHVQTLRWRPLKDGSTRFLPKLQHTTTKLKGIRGQQFHNTECFATVMSRDSSLQGYTNFPILRSHI